MNAVVLLGVALIVLAIAYRTYGRYQSRLLGIDPERKTPAHTERDGIDYEPAPAPVVLGHHFASIAGAGPIVGPIVAVAFGWLPAFIWILFGSIFIGATHDFTSLVASLRHRGKSVGELIEEYIGVRGKRLFIVFAFSTLILVIAVFTDVVKTAFIANPEVASASTFFILVALLFGALTRFVRLNLSAATVAGLGFLAIALAAGYQLPFELSTLSIGALTVLPATQWIIALLGYVFVASVTPVWMLLQPRDYLNSFLLYAMMGGAVVGIFVAQPTIEMPAFTGFYSDTLGPLFPILFITVACGAISGFHSLVASGSTSKQLSNERDAPFVGYGSMLIEAALAVVALIAASQYAAPAYDLALTEQGPIGMFGAGVGGFMAAVGIPEESAITFVSLTVSAFALTTLDTCARLARFLLQEFFATPDTRKESARSVVRSAGQNRFVTTFVVVVLGGALTFSGHFGQVWPVFGAANQLLAAIALLAVGAWLAKRKTPNAFVLIPMIFMYIVTTAALGILIYQNVGRENYALAVISSALLLLSLELLRQAYGVLRPRKLATD